MGHLANAEDFANNCILDEKTFRMYNCLPQYPNLNRGSWKKWEGRIRNLSQTDSLLIICGGTFTNRKIKENSKISVPDNCWKIVKSLTTNDILYILWFTNEKKSNESQISLELLLKNCDYKIDIK
jgi:endonuclease G